MNILAGQHITHQQLGQEYKILEAGFETRRVRRSKARQTNLLRVVFIVFLQDWKHKGDEVKTGGNETDTYLRVLGCPSRTVAQGKARVPEFKTIPQNPQMNAARGSIIKRD